MGNIRLRLSSVSRGEKGLEEDSGACKNSAMTSSLGFVDVLPFRNPARPSFLLSKQTCQNRPSRLHNLRISMDTIRPPLVQIPPELQSVRVLGLGMSGVDILATVDGYPKPDDKVRTTGVSVLGGGNTANTLTAVRRLGMPCALVSKVGKDMYGSAAIQELQGDGVDTSLVLAKEGVNTSFTYVIVDTKSGTRTCISTASNEDLLVSEIDESMLDNASLIVLDGRHTLAALQLAKFAKNRGIPILLDVERERPYIRDLLPYADYIVTNSVYPFVFSPGATGKVDAMQMLLEACDAKIVITTLGSSGSIMVQRENDREKGNGFDMIVRSTVVQSHRNSKSYEVIECPVQPVQKIVDSTGAGDAFIGGVIYGIVTNMSHERMLCLASRVAAKNLGEIGARAGLPRREDIAPTLLVSIPSL